MNELTGPGLPTGEGAAAEPEPEDSRLDAFRRRVLEGGPIAERPDFPLVAHDPDGDMIEVHLESANHHRKDVGHGVTLYLERGTDRVVGFEVGGIRGLMEGAGSRPTLTAAVCRDVPDVTLYHMVDMGGLAAILGAIGELRAATVRRDGRACEEWLGKLLAFGEDAR